MVSIRTTSWLNKVWKEYADFYKLISVNVQTSVLRYAPLVGFLYSLCLTDIEYHKECNRIELLNYCFLHNFH